MRTRLAVAVVSLVLSPGSTHLFAQDQQWPDRQQQQGPAARQFSPEQLDSLVAPVALYPDSLLSQVLVASTYPLELMEASQWLQQNGGLQGQAIVEAAQQQNWDPSIQALVAFPDVIKRLTSDIRWTTDLGNAFLAQQADVMGAVQDLRARARDNGRLTDNQQQRIVVENQNGQQAIEIQPADPQVVYVPTYNPDYFWGASPYYPWPSLYYPPVGIGCGWGYGIHVGLFFGGWGGWGGWGWGPSWFNRSVYVNNGFFDRYHYRGYGEGGYRGGTSVWAHNYEHRQGVPYANRGVAERYAGGNTHNNFRGATGGNYGGNYGGNNYGGRSAEPRYGNNYNNVQRGFQSTPQRGNENIQRGFQSQPRNNFQPSRNNYQQGNQFRGETPRATAPQQYTPRQYAPQQYAPQQNRGDQFRGQSPSAVAPQQYRGNEYRGGQQNNYQQPRSAQPVQPRAAEPRSFQAPSGGNRGSFGGGGGGSVSHGAAPESRGGGGGGSRGGGRR